MSLLKRKLAFMAVVNKVKGFVRNVVGIPPLTLPNAVGDDLLDYKVYGESKQNGTPSPDAPVEIESVGNKTVNLFDKNNAEHIVTGYVDSTKYQEASTTKSICVPCKPNTTYTISKKIISSRFIAGCTANIPKQNEPILVRVGGSSGTTITIKSTADSNYLVVWVYHSSYDAADVLDEILNSLQIEEGATATDYEPFGYKVPIKVIGKNLFDEAEFFNRICELETLDGYEPTYEEIDGRKGMKVYGRNLRYIDGVEQKLCDYPYKENTQYTLSFDFYDIPTPQSSGIDYYGAIFYCQYTDGTTDWYVFPANAAIRSKNEWRHHKFTSAIGKTIDKFTCLNQTGNAITYLANMQIEEGALETDYEPYKDLGTTNIYLAEPLRKAGDIADYIDFNNKCVIRNIAKQKVLDSNGQNITNSYSNIAYFRFEKPKDAVEYGNQSHTYQKYSEHFIDGKYDYAGFDNAKYINSIIVTGTTLYFIGFEVGTTLEEMKTALKDSYLYYILATPITEPIELPTIPTAKGTITVIADTTIQPSNMDVTYYSSI